MKEMLLIDFSVSFWCLLSTVYVFTPRRVFLKVLTLPSHFQTSIGKDHGVNVERFVSFSYPRFCLQR